MLTSITPKNMQALQNFIHMGRVKEVIDATRIRVLLHQDKRAFEIWTCFAMGHQPLPQVGDKVLIAGDDLEDGFIIGHFPANPTRTQSFVVEQEDGKTILTVPQGDLDLRAENIRLDAQNNIALNSPEFSLVAGKGDIMITDAQYKGARFGATIAQTKLFLGKLNSTVGRLIEKAKNAYRQVDNLNQLKAGRMRTVVEGSYHLKSERIVEKAEKDVRIDGEKINLG